MGDFLLDNLNSNQRQAVTHLGSPLLVLAGAGSGKTRVLTHRAAWLVSQGLAEPSQLLLLTFTNKAAGEMKERLSKLLATVDSHRFRPAKMFAGTFHSFCALTLRREGKTIGIDNNFVIFDEDDQKALLRDIMVKMDLSEKKFALPAVKSVIERAKNDLIAAPVFCETANNGWLATVGKVYQEYEKKMSQMQALDFDDLLFQAVRLFAENQKTLEEYQNHYRFILVDEYQDTNHSQYLLTKLLASKFQSLTVVGDAAQAIYSWRGADYRNLLNLASDFPNLKTINLELNYRSTQSILDAAYGVISRNVRHPSLHLVTQNGDGEKILVYRASSEADEAVFVTEKIKALLNFKGVDPTKVAVLYRTNAQSRVFEEVFIRHGLPYVLIGGVRFYDRAEIKDSLSLVRVFYNPKDLVSWQRLEKNLGKRRKVIIENFIEQNANKKMDTKTVLEKMLQITGYCNRFDPDEEKDVRRLENVKELASVAEKFSDIGDFLENVTLIQQEYSAQEKEKKNWEQEAVKLMTIHASKGLEFEAVFLVGLEEGLLPHSQNIEEEEKLEEERRLCYVGMTRARKHLFLTYSTQRLYFGKTSFNQPSRFLDEIPANLLIREEETDFGNNDIDEGWDLDDKGW